jgi:hypothetical protein
VVLRGDLLTRTLVALSDAGVRFVGCGGVACRSTIDDLEELLRGDR